MLDPCTTATKSVKDKNPNNTKYKKDSLLNTDSSLKDIAPIMWKMIPVNIKLRTNAKFSNISIASSDGVNPKVSAVSIELNSGENKLIISGIICNKPIAITILKIVFIFIVFVFNFVQKYVFNFSKT